MDVYIIYENMFFIALAVAGISATGLIFLALFYMRNKLRKKRKRVCRNRRTSYQPATSRESWSCQSDSVSLAELTPNLSVPSPVPYGSLLDSEYYTLQRQKPSPEFRRLQGLLGETQNPSPFNQPGLYSANDLLEPRPAFRSYLDEARKSTFCPDPFSPSSRQSGLLPNGYHLDEYRSYGLTESALRPFNIERRNAPHPLLAFMVFNDIMSDGKFDGKIDW